MPNFQLKHNYIFAFSTFLVPGIAKAVENHLCGIQAPGHPPNSISWLLMAWRRKEPGHQYQWYWLVIPEYSGCSTRRVHHHREHKMTQLAADDNNKVKSAPNSTCISIKRPLSSWIHEFATLYISLSPADYFQDCFATAAETLRYLTSQD